MMRAVTFAGALGVVPALGLLTLVLGGWVGAGPALVLVALTGATLLCFALLWVRDLDMLSAAVRGIAADEGGRLVALTPGLKLMDGLAQDIERLTRRVQDRTLLAQQFRRADEAILERLPDPLIVLSPDRTVQRANSAARAAFGAEIAAVLRHPGLRSAIDRAVSQGTSQSAEITLRVPTVRELLAGVVAMDPPLADGGRTLVVLSDRTRERAIERMRADFVANASHELRTPLASLIGFIDTLRGPAADDPPAQKRFLEIMAEQAGRMNRLIDDLLSLSRVELIEHQAPAERLDLHDVLARLVAGFEPRLAERSATLDVRIADPLPDLTGDADQIAQVVQNLLDNAVKYGPDGGVVKLAVQVAGADERWPARPGIVLSVSDQGPGVPREHIPRLTERFYRVDKGRSRAVGGTGLGLAIVKHIVNRHRGQLLIESEPGAGTTVSVWLPMANVAASARLTVER